MPSLTEYLDRKNSKIFRNRTVFSDSYIPEVIPFREKEINTLYTSLSPALEGEKPLNVFIYGQTGTGKTLTAKYVAKELEEEEAKKKNSKTRVVYINCKFASVTRDIKAFIKELSLAFNQKFEDFFDFFNYLDETGGTYVLIFDEIDQLAKDLGGDILYTLTRAELQLKKAKVGVVGISNNIFFVDKLDPRVRSSLSDIEIPFSPYNALQLREILKQRAEKGFNKGAYEEAVIAYIAAVSAREHGDARRAINLLRLAGEIAESKGKDKVTLEDAKEAVEMEEMDKVKAVVNTLPTQSRLILLAIAKLRQSSLGRAYDNYSKLAMEMGISPVTFRRFVEIVNDLEMLGLVSIDFAVYAGKKYRRVRTFINPSIIQL